MTTNQYAEPVIDDLDVQVQLLALYGEALSSITLRRCVAECRRALETVDRMTASNLELLARSTVEQVMSSRRPVGVS